jgi:hypothetical protein
MTSHMIDRALQQLVNEFENGQKHKQANTSSPSSDVFKAPLNKVSSTKEFIAGGAGAFCSRTLTSPLSVCQVNMQTSVGIPLPFKKAVQSIMQTNGILGFWAGNNAAILRIIPSTGLKFSLFRNFHANDSVTPSHNVTISAMTSGALAGIISVLVLHPIDVIKIQMVVRSTNVWPAVGKYASTNVDNGIRDATLKIIARDGYQGFYRGISINLIGVTFLEGSRFAAYETFKSWWKNEKLSNGEVLHHGHYAAMGYLSGMISQAITYPIDVVRRRVIVSGTGEWNGMRRSGSLEIQKGNNTMILAANENARQVIKHIWTEENIKSFFRGAFINKLKNPIGSAVTFTVYEMVISFLHHFDR